MAKSRTALGFLAAAATAATPAAAAAAPLTAEQAVAVQRSGLRSALNLDCRRGGDEILVCGRGERDPNRIPLPDERVPGERPRLMPGELPSGVEASYLGSGGCSTVGPNQSCGGGLDIFRVGSVLLRIGRHLLDRDD